MSSIAQQLQNQNPFNTSTSRKPSILFTEEKAHQINDLQVFQLAVNGWIQLCRLDTRFVQFQQNIFLYEQNPKSFYQLEGLDLLDPDQRSSVASIIQQFLHLLQPYFTQNCALQCLEFLIRKFKYIFPLPFPIYSCFYSPFFCIHI